MRSSLKQRLARHYKDPGQLTGGAAEPPGQLYNDSGERLKGELKVAHKIHKR